MTTCAGRGMRWDAPPFLRNWVLGGDAPPFAGIGCREGIPPLLRELDAGPGFGGCRPGMGLGAGMPAREGRGAAAPRRGLVWSNGKRAD